MKCYVKYKDLYLKSFYFDNEDDYIFSYTDNIHIAKHFNCFRSAVRFLHYVDTIKKGYSNNCTIL